MAENLPGAGALARLGALDAWVRRLPAAPEPAAMHELLTHVVDETAAICDTIGRELLGSGPPPASPGAVES
jgi:hypothetical protein